jgi:hypothetical protein
MVVLAEVENLADDVDMSGVGAVARSPGQIAQPVDPLFAVTAQPPVIDRATDPVVAARHRDVAGHFLGVLDDRQPATDLTWQQRIAHAGLLLIGDPELSTMSVSFRGGAAGNRTPCKKSADVRKRCV